jgi:hypothetical protein
MNTDEIKNMIDLFADGELQKEKEPILFTSLSQDNEAREYFKGVNYIKHAFQQTLEEYPHNLDDKVLRSVEKFQHKHSTVFINKKTFLFLSCSVVAICIFVTVMFYNKSENYKEQFVNLTHEIKKQNADLQLILNAMPEIEVRSGYYSTKEVVVKASLKGL